MDESEQVGAFWLEFCAATGTDPAAPHDVWPFGDGPELADELLALVLAGTKRATAGLVVEYEADGDPVPRPGHLSVVLDGSGVPRCVLRTTEVEIKPLRDADAAFAHDEGEGDRTLAWWRAAHEEYFRRVLPGIGVEFDDSLPCVFERFDLAWVS